MRTKPKILKADKAAIASAIAVLEAGGLVALPTETVYGLAADATNGAAVARIFEAKGRPSFNPLICHISSLEMAERYGEFDEAARELAGAFWPGPLTIVVSLAQTSDAHDLVSAGLKTIGLRHPQGIAADLIEAFGRPLAAPSANRSGKISPTSADHVVDDLGGRVDLILDGGPCSVGVESTIVKVELGSVTLLREGGVTRQALEDVLGSKVAMHSGANIEAPGMMQSHYAPSASVRLNADTVEPNEALLAFGSELPKGWQSARATINLSETSDLLEAAARLYGALRALDASGARSIAVAPIPETGIGAAIKDRLRRAAAPRDA